VNKFLPTSQRKTTNPKTNWSANPESTCFHCICKNIFFKKDLHMGSSYYYSRTFLGCFENIQPKRIKAKRPAKEYSRSRSPAVSITIQVVDPAVAAKIHNHFDILLYTYILNEKKKFKDAIYESILHLRYRSATASGSWVRTRMSLPFTAP